MKAPVSIISGPTGSKAPSLSSPNIVDEAKVIAGGQSLVPMLAFRLAAPRFLVDIGSIARFEGHCD